MIFLDRSRARDGAGDGRRARGRGRSRATRDARNPETARARAGCRATTAGAPPDRSPDGARGMYLAITCEAEGGRAMGVD